MISIIIPAYNVVEHIKNVITATLDMKIIGEGENIEVIIAEDGSSDGTKEVVEEFAKRYENVILTSSSKRSGKGAAIKRGFEIAKGDIVGFIDADESIGIKDLENLFDALSNADVVIASRWLKSSKIIEKQPLRRRFASRVFNIFVRVIFNLPFKDTQCGAKVFKKEAIKDILNEINAKGFEFDVELLWRLKKRGYKIKEIPITWKHEEKSSFQLSYAPQMLLSLLKIRVGIG
jgi:glycosyltransferase involved in cell wall biosynthesis